MSKLLYLLLILLVFIGPLALSVFDGRMLIFPVAFLIYEIWRIWSHFSGGEWVPTPDKIIDRMLKLAKVSKDDIVYDLGSGDGKIVLKAAKLGAKAIGVEIDPLRVLVSRLKLKLSRLDKNAKIVYGNFFEIDVKNADVVTLFLLPKTMVKIENKLKKELGKGARLVSYRFTFKSWKPVKIDKESKIYLYRI